MGGQRFGTGEAGFSIDEDAASTLRLETWGFWDSELAGTFVRVAVDNVRARRHGRIVVDVTRLKPQREEGQTALRSLMGAIRSAGGARVVAVVGDNTLTKMQLIRIGRDVGGMDWSFVATEPRA